MAKKKNVTNLKDLYNKERIKELMNEEKSFGEPLEEADIKPAPSKTKNKIHVNETYKHSEFLETDHQKLQNLEKLYSKKLFILNNFSQSETLIQGQNEELLLIKEKVKDILLIENSRFLESMEYIWDDSFNSEDI